MNNEVKVLYVEDEPYLAQIVQESLQSRGFHVLLAEDGLSALNSFSSFEPHICVLDVMLPQMDGFELARNIKKIQPDIPLIFLTAKTQTTDLLEGFQSGGNDYLRKPFSMEELIVRINNLLELTGRRSPEEKPIVEKTELGTFTFFPRHFELHHDEEIKKLSHRETQLIQMLTTDTSRPVLRKDILLQLWGDDSFYNSRNLDVYISRLRDYFSPDPNIRIVTLKGIGYQFRIL